MAAAGAGGGGGDSAEYSADDADRSSVRVHYAIASSTMDRAKELCGHWGESRGWIVVTARQQRKGRGTGGRSWLSPAGNTYLSVCVSKAALGARLGLLPLETGLATLHALLDFLPPSVAAHGGTPRGGAPAGGGGAAAPAVLSLKWPNDVLLGAAKVSGTLIEDGGSHMIVGIGVNVAEAPPVAALADGGRPSGCLADVGCARGDAVLVGERIAARLRERLEGPRGDVVAEYSRLVDWAVPVHERIAGGGRGPPLRALRLSPHGHLVVADPAVPEGERALVSDYLY